MRIISLSTLKASMEIKPIKTEVDYHAALGEVETMMTTEADTPEGDRLDILVTLVEAYERKHYALDLPDPFVSVHPLTPATARGPIPGADG